MCHRSSPVEHDRHTTKLLRTSPIANSIAYTAALAALYAGNFDEWRSRMGWRKPTHKRALQTQHQKQLALWQDTLKEINPIK